MVITDFSLVTILGLVVSAVLPLVVALVTKWSTHSAIKALLLVFLTVLTTSLSQLYTQLHDHGGGIEWKSWFVNFVIAYTLAVASYYGLWKQTPIQPALQNSVVKDKPEKWTGEPTPAQLELSHGITEGHPYPDGKDHPSPL